MSGGSMDYVFGRIYEAAESVREFRRDTAAKPDDDFEFDAKRMESTTPAELKKKVVQYLVNAEVALREAEVYAKRVEWLESGDDGYDNFIERTDEDRAELAKSMGVELAPPKPYEVDVVRDALVGLMDAMERRGWLEYETVDDGDPLYKAWHQAKKALGTDMEDNQ